MVTAFALIKQVPISINGDAVTIPRRIIRRGPKKKIAIKTIAGVFFLPFQEEMSASYAVPLAHRVLLHDHLHRAYHTSILRVCHRNGAVVHPCRDAFQFPDRFSLLSPDASSGRG